MRRLIPTLQLFAQVTDALGAEKFVSVSSLDVYIEGLGKHLLSKVSAESRELREFARKSSEEMTSRYGSATNDIIT